MSTGGHNILEPALFGKTETSSTQVGKWVGACPADMKAGDVVTANGMKFNLHAMLESKAAASEAPPALRGRVRWPSKDTTTK